MSTAPGALQQVLRSCERCARPCSTRVCHDCSVSKSFEDPGHQHSHTYSKPRGWWGASGKVYYYEQAADGIQIVQDLRSDTERAADEFSNALLEESDLSNVSVGVGTYDIKVGELPQHSHSIGLKDLPSVVVWNPAMGLFVALPGNEEHGHLHVLTIPAK